MESLHSLSRFFFRPSWGLFLIRLGVGSIFLHHGWMKVQNIAGTVGFMAKVGIPAPLAYAAIVTEVVGGLMLIVGIWSRVAAVALGIVALVATFAVSMPMRGLSGSEFELLLAAAAFGLALTGAGKLRLTHTFEHEQ